MQLRKQGSYGIKLGKDVTDVEVDLVEARKRVSLSKDIVGTIVESNGGKDRTVDLEHTPAS